MDFNELADTYNEFIDGKNYVWDRNETGSSDVLNDKNLIDNDNTVNEVGYDDSSTNDEDWNNSESEDSDDYNTSSNNDLVDEVNEEEAVDLRLDGKENMSIMSTNVNDLEPTISMVFSTDDEAYQRYNSYAKEMGFSVRKYRVDRSKLEKHVVSRYYICSNQND
ncbi:protein FAR1-RELATED SEQUENCE 11-like [Telopea speciosissima]|uniref:protein FAR1-RELATED SEQUENCE 11-like n=1 Tax=Telopea speciosissima TaxID=54955 RepID=UPI001CC6D99F|nr:protein FAR1-RELATED SEQUENCE 11-like [Telopea speciosissima]